MIPQGDNGRYQAGRGYPLKFQKTKRMMNREEQRVKPWIVLKHPIDDVPVWIRGLAEVRDVESVERGKMYVIERKRLEDYYLDK